MGFCIEFYYLTENIFPIVLRYHLSALQYAVVIIGDRFIFKSLIIKLVKRSIEKILALHKYGC